MMTLNPFKINTNFTRSPTQSPPLTVQIPSSSPRQFDSFMGFTRRKGYTTTRPPLIVYPNPTYTQPGSQRQQTITQLVNNPPSAQESKILWGEPTWFLFHTLAEKVHESDFDKIRTSLLEIIYTISIHLPCPSCASHAKQHLDGINFNAIQTKAQLKQMLFEFHNAVNKRKNFPLFLSSDLDEKYSKAITLHIIQNFMMQFEKKTKSVRLIADDLHRQRMTVTLKTWFNNNVVYFTP